MIREVSDLLMEFYSCFSRQSSFFWFVITVFGLIVRNDAYGVTSMIRWLSLKPALYLTYLNFFRASSWKLEEIQQRWSRIVQSRCPLVTIGDAFLLVGDGIKVAKEAHRMPAVKKLHQESDNSSKPPYIFGHHFGVLGLLVGNAKKMFCVPLMAELHEGVETIREFQGKGSPAVNGRDKLSLTTLMASFASRLTRQLGHRCIVVLDAYFAVGPSFLVAQELLDSGGNRMLHLITRAKRNVVAYEDQPPKTGKKGRPPLYGKKLNLMQLFCLRADQFRPAVMNIYSQSKTVSFLCLDLLWKPTKGKMRFVLVMDGTDRFILMCSNLNLDPLDIIKAYSYRFKIEVSFKVMKHVIGAFCYHFWTKALPKLSKKTANDLATVVCEKNQRLIAQAANAIEGFVNFGCIATGILQIIALNYDKLVWKNYYGWLRTITSEIPSEETVRSVIQENFFHNFRVFKDTLIYAIIMEKSSKTFRNRDKQAA